MAILLAANANFVPTSPFQIAKKELSAIRWGMEELNDRLADYGYGGVELHWSDRFAHCRDLRTATPEIARVLGRSVITGHEGWRGTADPEPAASCSIPRRGLTERESLKTRLGSALLLPTGAVSLDRLEETEYKLGRPELMHYVMFPDEQGRREVDQAKTRRFRNSSIQPTVDVGASWGVVSNEDFIEELITRGYQATLASFHMSRRGKVIDSSMKHWRELAEGLLKQGLVPEVHIEVARSDFGKVDPERYEISNQEARALINNEKLDGTPLGDLFALLREYKWMGRVVNEATIPGLSATFGKLTPKLVTELHQGLAEGAKRELPHITWEPFPQKPATT